MPEKMKNQAKVPENTLYKIYERGWKEAFEALQLRHKTEMECFFKDCPKDISISLKE